MPQRAITRRAELPGETLEIEDGDRRYTLFLPKEMKRTEDVTLAIHFHSAQWHAIQEHLDRGLDGPMIAFYPGEGSSVYGKSFEDKDRLGRWKERVAQELRNRGFPDTAQVKRIDITSFSAGYGAVRQLLKDADTFKSIGRVILGDSLYGSLDATSAERIPAREHIEVWLPLAQAALRGEKEFVITYSAVKTPTYASSSECARAIVSAVHGQMKPIERGSLPATLDPQFPLLERFDSGKFHVWGYGGEDAAAHMTHARHLADVWKALDAARGRQ